MKWLGIDEAGRGCVLGDLVVAGFLYEGDDPASLAALGATDSKKLSSKRRLEAREKLSTAGTPIIERVTPAQIDAGNLNHLEEQAIAGIIQRTRPDMVIIDALGHPSTLPATIQRLLQAVSPLSPNIIMEPKADLSYAVCGAASIFAKTDRDMALEELKAQYGTLGSGYPSDPKTKAWLQAHANTGSPWPPFVRTRWGTVRALSQTSLLT